MSVASGVKRRIQTSVKLPILNWVPLPKAKITNTIFAEIDDENAHATVDFSEFESTFKLKEKPRLCKGGSGQVCKAVS